MCNVHTGILTAHRRASATEHSNPSTARSLFVRKKSYFHQIQRQTLIDFEFNDSLIPGTATTDCKTTYRAVVFALPSNTVHLAYQLIL